MRSIRTLPSRIAGNGPEETSIWLDELSSSPERPGFQLLVDRPPIEFVVGAIGKVWQLDIPFVHVPDAEAFAAFAEKGFVKVAWAIHLSSCGERDTHLTFEVRVDATDGETIAEKR